MSDDHRRAVCPVCETAGVTIYTAPMKPPKMRCTNCQWDSLEADDD